MTTSACMWNIHNTTRYNTDDIIRLFTGYEAWAKHMGSEIKADRGREEGTVRFVDYTPMRDTYSRHVLTPSGTVVETLRVFIRGPSPFVRHLRDVGLVKPARLYSNPVEALSAPRVEGREVVPAGFVQQLLTDAVAECYLTTPHLRPSTDGFPFDDFSIRIETRRASEKVTRSTRPQTLQALKAEGVELKWQMNCLEQNIIRVRDTLQGMSDRFQQTGIEPALTVEKLNAFLTAFGALEIDRQSDDRTILKEMQ